MADQTHQWSDFGEVPIEELGVPRHITRRLRRVGIDTIGKLEGQSEDSLSRISLLGTYSFGAVRIGTIQQALEALGLPRLPKDPPQ